MHTKNMKTEFETFITTLAWGAGSPLTLIVAPLLGLLLVMGFATSTFAQESQARTFSSPAEAVSALVQAAQAGDERALESILGAGKEVTSSSDEEEDKL